MLKNLRNVALALVLSTVPFAAMPAKAAHWSLYKQWNFAKPAFIHDLPFVEKKVVLQVSQNDAERWNLALNNASNLLEIFGQGKVRIVVVAYGPGLKMLLANTSVAARIQSLDAEDVEFDACYQTMLGIQRQTGHMPELVPQAVVVPGGVVRIMQLEENGFDYLKP
jgi:intracellular sulfur oxidation DsrE/DsrF family protein